MDKQTEAVIMSNLLEFGGSTIREVGYTDMGSGMYSRIVFGSPLVIKAHEKKRIAKKKLKKALENAYFQQLDFRATFHGEWP